MELDSTYLHFKRVIMKILLTGSAGFIGNNLAQKLLARGDIVIGVDNLNAYYDVNLKQARLNKIISHKNYTHINENISNKENIYEIFKTNQPEIVVNLAAQAGVRHSISNPEDYINSNIIGFQNILDASKDFKPQHIVFASSSSVYGANKTLPFSTQDNVDHPLNLYAASKKANELVSHAYSHIYEIPMTGLRFFTVYGPWGRPDMALFKFAEQISNEKKIQVFNNGNHSRDFTYIDDIVNGVIKVIDNPPSKADKENSNLADPSVSDVAPWKIYNIGNNSPVELMYFIELIEKNFNKKAKMEFMPLQVGDVPNTYANIDDLKNNLDFMPKVSIEEGIANFCTWYKEYYE